MARSARSTRAPRGRSAQKLAIEDTTAGLPKIQPPAEPPVSFADAIAEQADAEGKTEEEVLAELTAVPPEGERPVRPVGTSNLACTIRNHRANYRVMLHPNGKKTQNNGDPVALWLLNIPLAALKDFSGLHFNGRRYDHLNDGHARMCIGNLLRAAWTKGDTHAVEWMLSFQPKVEEAAEEEAA